MTTETASPNEPWNQPAPWILFLRKHIWLIGGGLLLLMITVMRPLMIRRPPPPEITGEVPAFTLVDQNGETFTREAMLAEDKVFVFGFVFTRCVTTCPAVSRAMQDFQQQIADSKLSEHVELVAVSVDPKYDTPEVLSAYADHLGADLDNFRFVTGSEAEIQHFVVDGFKLAMGEEAKEVEPGVFDIAHSTKLALVDRWGHVRGYYSIDPEGLNELYHRTIRVIRLEEGE